MGVIWWWLTRKRKRSHSRPNSPTLSPSKVTRRLNPILDSVFHRGGSSSKSPPTSFRFLFRTRLCRVRGLKTFILEIQSSDLGWVRDVDPCCFTRHDHCHGDPTRFRRIRDAEFPKYLQRTTQTPYTRPAAIDDNVYALFYNGRRRCLEFLSFDLTGVAMHLLPAPSSPNRCTPKILSLRGKIYLLGGLFPPSQLKPLSLGDDFDPLSIGPQPFGEVFDPLTNEWSPLKQPPKASALTSRSKIFIASLGELEGKIMIYDYDTQRSMIYIYDVVDEEWKFYHPGSDFHCIFEPRFIYGGQEVINEDDNNLYWLDERKGYVYAFDWKAMRVYSGPIVGMEHSSTLKYLDQSFQGIVLHHLWGDIFCLMWTDFVFEDLKFQRTQYHFTFVRVIKSSDDNLLDAFVLGCFMDSVDAKHDFFDAIRV